MQEKFKELKHKMLKKLNHKNEEISKYATCFEDLERRLTSIENL
jgi:hypothetical protein